MQIAPGGGNAGPSQRLSQWQATKQKERLQANHEHAAAAARGQWLQAASLARSAQARALRGQGFASIVTAARKKWEVSNEWCGRDAAGTLECALIACAMVACNDFMWNGSLQSTDNDGCLLCTTVIQDGCSHCTGPI
eukprot:1138709-Pelagomonas_calceolata.AAC.5